MKLKFTKNERRIAQIWLTLGIIISLTTLYLFIYSQQYSEETSTEDVRFNKEISGILTTQEEVPQKINEDIEKAILYTLAFGYLLYALFIYLTITLILFLIKILLFPAILK